MLPLVDILLPSVPEDTGSLFGLEDPEEVVDYFRAKGVPVVIAKAGPLGAWGSWEDETRHWPPEATEVVDAIGAGDAFCAGMLLGIHERWEIEKSLLLAVCSAAMSLSEPGCTEACTNLTDTLALAEKFPFQPAVM